MFHIKAYGVRYVMLQIVHRFVRKTEHKVYADILYSGISKRSYSKDGIIGIMTTMEKAETFVGKGLNTHANPGYSACNESLGEVAVYVIGIAFNGEFKVIGIHIRMVAKSFGKAMQIVRGKRGWRSTTYIYSMRTLA